jgi:ribosomal protein S27E
LLLKDTSDGIENMSKQYKVIVQTIENNKITKESTVIQDAILAPESCLDFALGIEQHMKLIHGVQDHVLNEKLLCLSEQQRNCPKCPGNLVKRGKQHSAFHDIFSDHKVTFIRMRCSDCDYESPCTTRSQFGCIQSGDLQKVQSELGSKHSFREAQDILSIFSGRSRGINNHDRIKQITEKMGDALYALNTQEQKMAAINQASELIVNVDGGHVKTTENQRSIEAIASVVYRPESLVPNEKGTRNQLISKHCAASVKDDHQREIVTATTIAAIKEGLGPQTHITALCDGASNCWNVAQALEPHCKSITYILDWFHVAMKMENIALPSTLKSKFMRVKWHLWRGNTGNALTRLNQLMGLSTNKKAKEKLKAFYAYIVNNANKIIDYRARKKAGLVFTSNLAECTVESLINQRCKGKQHMRWTRAGLNPVLQLRAAIHSVGEWNNKWRSALLNAIAV